MERGVCPKNKKKKLRIKKDTITMFLQLFDIIFYFFATVTLISAGIVVFSKNIVRSAFSLVFTFFGIAGLYVLLNADFVAVAQLFVYVGGILVLLLFAVMLTQKISNLQMKITTLHPIIAIILVASLIGVLCGIVRMNDWRIITISEIPQSTAQSIGKALITTHILPFEIISVILLVAIIGAAMLARKSEKKS